MWEGEKKKRQDKGRDDETSTHVLHGEMVTLLSMQRVEGFGATTDLRYYRRERTGGPSGPAFGEKGDEK